MQEFNVPGTPWGKGDGGGPKSIARSKAVHEFWHLLQAELGIRLGKENESDPEPDGFIICDGTKLTVFVKDSVPLPPATPAKIADCIRRTPYAA